MRPIVPLLVWFLRAVFAARGFLALENLALRQQPATYARGQTSRFNELTVRRRRSQTFERPDGSCADAHCPLGHRFPEP